MKKLLFLGILLLGFGLQGEAQVKQIRFVNALPSSCISNISPPVIYQGKVYQCTSGTYQLSGGGIAVGDSPTLTGAWTWSLANAAAVAIGPNGNTNPVLRVVTNVASAATGLSITGNAAGSGVTLQALSSGASETLSLLGKGTTALVRIGGLSTLSGLYVDSTVNSETVTLYSNFSGAVRFLAASGGQIQLGTAGRLNWKDNADAAGGSVDLGLTRHAAGVLRVAGASTGAGRLLIGTSSDTSAAQLDVRSQTVGVPAGQFQAASGESASAANLVSKNGAGTTTFSVRADGGLAFDRTITAGGTTGAQTINKSAFSVNFAASATSLVVTNSVVSTTSGAICQVMTNDSTMKHVQAVAGSGTLTLYPDEAPTAETKVYCEIRN